MLGNLTRTGFCQRNHQHYFTNEIDRKTSIPVSSMRLRAISFEYRITNSESPFTFRRSSKKKKKKKETSIQSYVCQFTLRSKTNCSRILQNITRLNIKKMGKILERSRFSMSREYFDIVSLDECLSNCEKICPVLINNKKKVRMHFFSRICCTPFPRI